jgi:hypothetical protein
VIAAMLGFAQAEHGPLARVGSAPLPGAPMRPPGEGLAAGERPSAAAIPLAGGEDIGVLIAFDVERSTAPAQRIVLSAEATLQRLAHSPLPLRPLFEPLWERGLLIEAAGTPCWEGDLAVLEAVEVIARGEALQELPAERIQSVSRGCQVLIDTGLGMQPFASDCRQIARSIRRSVGAEHTRVLTFADCPKTGVMTENYSDAEYAAPENGAMVVALSDLCRGGPRGAIREAEPEDWLAVVRAIRDAGSSLAWISTENYSPKREPGFLRPALGGQTQG